MGQVARPAQFGRRAILKNRDAASAKVAMSRLFPGNAVMCPRVSDDMPYTMFYLYVLLVHGAQVLFSHLRMRSM